MGQSRSECKRWLEAARKETRQYVSQIDFLTESIERAKTQLPELQKLIEHYKRSIPKWCEDLDVQKRSFLQHQKHTAELHRKLQLLIRIDKAEADITKLNKELKKENQE